MLLIMVYVCNFNSGEAEKMNRPLGITGQLTKPIVFIQGNFYDRETPCYGEKDT